MLDIGGKHNLIGDINSIVIVFLSPPGIKAIEQAIYSHHKSRNHFYPIMILSPCI